MDKVVSSDVAEPADKEKKKKKLRKKKDGKVICLVSVLWGYPPLNDQLMKADFHHLPSSFIRAFCCAEETLQAAAYADALGQEGEEPAPTPRIIHDQGRIAGITIHRTDKLKTDFFIAHPVVRISIVDISCGDHLSKQTKLVRSILRQYLRNVIVLSGLWNCVLPFLQRQSCYFIL